MKLPHDKLQEIPISLERSTGLAHLEIYKEKKIITANVELTSKQPP
jgi:hypothetical protein